MTKFQDPFSEEVWAATYKDHNDKNVNDTIRRVARAVASVEASPLLQDLWEEKFYDLLSDFKVTAGGRIYANAGTEWQGTTLLNCFVGPRASYDIDSINGILTHLQAQTKTLKSEGGWGENFSYIRPRGAFIKGIGVETPGAVKYMELFDKSSEIITEGSGLDRKEKKAKGKIRKGAMMGVMDIWHPDVIEFITAKQTAFRLTKFNMSVNISDEFMSVLENDGDWNLRFPETDFEHYHSEWDGDIKKWEAKGYPVRVYNTVKASWLWNLIMESTYKRAEPGVLFLDRANYFNPLFYAETIFATNPCGEQTLAPGNVCNLGSINLTQFVDGNTFGFDYHKIKKYVKILVRFLDNVCSLTLAPLPEYEDSVKNKRRIGCGLLGWGSALYMMQIPFASVHAQQVQQELMQTIARSAYEASIDLAEEKGMFPLCEPEKHAESPYIKQLGLSDQYMEKLRKVGIRNSSLMSIQPTGGTSIFANVVSGGCEPVFLHSYIRTVIVPEAPVEIRDKCPKWFQGEYVETDMFKWVKEGEEDILRGEYDGVVYKIDRNRGLTKEVLCEDYGVRYLKSIDEWDPNASWAKTTEDLTVEDHLTDLKGFAKWVDSAISKTVNVPNDYPFEEFKNIYIDAYNTGYIKGITTYRSGTMTSVLSAKEEKNATNEDEEIILDDIKLPDSLPATVKILKAEGRKWYLTVISDEAGKRPVALFCHTNSPEKNVTTNDAVEKLIDLAKIKGIPQIHIDTTLEKIKGDNNTSKLTRCISLLLRHGVLIKNVVSVLNQVDGVFIGTFLFQIRKYLGSYIKDGEKVHNMKCEDCGSTSVVYSEGCHKCSNCGSSKCG